MYQVSIKIYTSTFLILILFGTSVYAQPSLVPVYHQVYDWLHYQRVRGNAPNYNYEALPLTRFQISDILNEIEKSRISSRDQHVLKSYKREFSVDSLANYKTNTVLQAKLPYLSGKKNYFSKTIKTASRITNLFFSEEEPHLYVWSGDHSTVAFDYFFGPTSVFVEDGGTNISAPYYFLSGIRSYGDIFNIIGFHYEQWRAIQVGEDQAFAYLPFLSRNAKFLRPGNETPNKTHVEAFAGLQYKFMSFHFGRGTLKYGVGQQNNLVFSRESIPTDWIRLNINSKHLKFTSLIGGLSWQPFESQIPLFEGSDQYTRVAPQRWVVHQRIQIQPFDWLSFGIYELNLFSNRGLELAYLNPINRLSHVEWEYYDQGNGFVGFEGVLRPFKGVELFGEILVDDLGAASDIYTFGKRKFSNSKFGRYFGFIYALKSGTVLTSTYQRIDPNVYAHKFILNSHAEKGFALGSQIGPNGDEMSFAVDQWLSYRTRISIKYAYNRHGLNVKDSEGNIIKDVGGDVLESYTINPETNRPEWQNIFLDGDLHRWNQYTIGFTYEPWRGTKIFIDYSYRFILEGNKITNLFVFNTGIRFGY